MALLTKWFLFAWKRSFLVFAVPTAAKKEDENGSDLDRQHNGYLGTLTGVWGIKKTSIGRRRKGWSTQDPRGPLSRVPLRCFVCLQAISLIWQSLMSGGLGEIGTQSSMLLQIKVMTAFPSRDFIKKQGKISVIPRCKGAICAGVSDRERYKTRHTVERFFSHIKEYKRLICTLR